MQGQGHKWGCLADEVFAITERTRVSPGVWDPFLNSIQSAAGRSAGKGAHAAHHTSSHPRKGQVFQGRERVQAGLGGELAPQPSSSCGGGGTSVVKQEPEQSAHQLDPCASRSSRRSLIQVPHISAVPIVTGCCSGARAAKGQNSLPEERMPVQTSQQIRPANALLCATAFLGAVHIPSLPPSSKVGPVINPN